ncbi:bifunctional glycosyltransferase family 2 protein/CDP-glycerol:glycerophosphate glycerophosphotransferase [Actinoplanes sp. Pm04-4]|uniref:Bifunctional glycosyltransferase family 2 protein/CDP-glycerol:glycerophosphate glycerophosphotransferase n=1 Tax=Paractinoplanes pyxinae TaxID=2997416 RepID=A0ABT4ATB9_9ACTN|nr:bifunctional glycosyltransferase family 2 protein/CDP-glycerol:glycerophosphate glycerophosphotransferase [Actinoplanes pyxinae]MCY1137478.1 bifunctional glycosyltransferase family 2 protein/CDP-glycerol:glycerophosphate glycerophosphotransferase [Actinoplanes pyxinae]
MTFLSIVLPVYKVQGYLRQCLDSVLSQSFTDFEVVAVDDRSPDYSGAILAEYAARDPRVRVVTAPENVGLGRARNLGLEHATGEYVWFVDSDDWLSEGTLNAAAERLRETDADLLIVGWDRVHWDGRVQAGTARKSLAAAPDVFSVEQWPQVLNILHVAWNKVVRREFLLRLGFVFEAGWYEDVSFSFPVMLAAPRISTLPRTCVHYRQRRTGAITRTVGDRHFEVFDHWEHAQALATKYASPTDEVRGLLFRRMIWHFLRVLRHDARVPRESRARFFGRMSEMYKTYLPPAGYPVPARAEGVRYRMVARGSYRSMRLFDFTIAQARRGKRVLRRTAGWVKRRARQAAGQVYYRVQRRLPVDQSLALYGAYWFRGVTCNPAAIAAKAAELAPHLRPVWVVAEPYAKSMPPGVEHVVAGTLPYYRAIARARYLVNNVNWPNRLVKRRGTTHVMTHHGTPLKKMGADQADHPAGVKDPDFQAQMRRADRWDFSVTANPFTTVAWESAYPSAHETLEVGYPRNDRLAAATAADSAAARERLGIPADRRVVLYMPTHREWLPPGRRVLDTERFAEELGPDTTLLVREHYFTTPAEPASGAAVDVSDHPVVEDLYLAADVLLTDYSSAMFDFAVLDRPVVIFAPDWPVYRDVRGVYFDLLAEPPGAVTTGYPALIGLFHSGAYADESAASVRSKFRKRFCSLDDGHAAERVVRRVFLDKKQ